jgi:hypothetical protein
MTTPLIVHLFSMPAAVQAMIYIYRNGTVSVDASQRTGLWSHLVVVMMMYLVSEKMTESGAVRVQCLAQQLMRN